MTPQPNQLWNLSGALFDLLEAREEAFAVLQTARDWRGDFEASPVPAAEAELAAIEHGITQFVAQQLRDVDGLRAPLKALEQGVAINKADAAAATNRAMILQNRYDKLKDLIRSCMIALDQAGEWKPKESRKFESARGSFTLRGNGGAQPVEITDESLVPDEYQRFTVTMTGEQFALIQDRVDSWKTPCHVRREVSRSAVAEALAKPCTFCKGIGSDQCLLHGHEHIEQYPDGRFICGKCGDDGAGEGADLESCPQCGGSKTQGVPGARLGERGQSVVVK